MSWPLKDASQLDMLRRPSQAKDQANAMHVWKWQRDLFPRILNVCGRAVKIRLGLVAEDIKCQIERYGS